MLDNTNPVLDMIKTTHINPCLECGKELTFKKDVSFFDSLEHSCKGFNYSDTSDTDILEKIKEWNWFNVKTPKGK